MRGKTRCVIVMIAAALILWAGPACVLPAGAVTQSDIQAIRDRLDDAAAQK